MPRLMPLGLFPVVPRNLSFMDVRMLVSDEDFKQYLEFFSTQLRTSRDVPTAAPRMLTVSNFCQMSASSATCFASALLGHGAAFLLSYQLAVAWGKAFQASAVVAVAVPEDDYTSCPYHQKAIHNLQVC